MPYRSLSMLANSRRPDRTAGNLEARQARVRSAAKALADWAAALAVLPCVLAFRITGTLAGRERAFPGWSQAFALIPGLTGVYLRRAFYRAALALCGDDVWLGFGLVISGPGAEFGRRVYVGAFCSLGEVTLEDDVLLGNHASVMNGGAQHGTGRTDVPIRDQPGNLPRVTVGSGSWVGERAVVMADVGRHCVIGAGAVVSRPVPDYAVAVGVPAKVIRFRDHPGPCAAAAQVRTLFPGAAEAAGDDQGVSEIRSFNA
jgi:virginiamycin A acetyltransferase